jgi:FeS assembly protein IscX
MPDRLKWTDVEEIALRLHETHPARDPLTLRFTELRRLVEALSGFQEEPGHPCNEAILEAIQAAWVEECEGGQR